MAVMAVRLRGVERTGPRKVIILDAEPLRQTFVTIVHLVRSLAER
jgi:hypothetical protein